MLRQANRIEKALYGGINQFYVAFHRYLCAGRVRRQNLSSGLRILRAGDRRGFPDVPDGPWSRHSENAARRLKAWNSRGLSPRGVSHQRDGKLSSALHDLETARKHYGAM